MTAAARTRGLWPILWEELDILRKGGNYGWRILEGNHIFDPTVATALGVNVPALDYPIFEYGHGPIGIVIIGGFVYRGTNYPRHERPVCLR